MSERPKPTPRPVVVLAVFAALGAGCSDDEFPHFGELLYQGDDIEAYASEGLSACGGTYAYAERWLASFRGRVGGYAERAPSTFYWLTEEDFDGAPCPAGNVACAHAEPNIIYSRVSLSTHELAHVELDRSFAPDVLREGAAEVFGADAAMQLQTELPPLLDQTQIPATAYETAGRFSRLLIDDYGLDAYFELHDALVRKEGRSAFEAEVVAVLGVEWSRLEANFEAYASCSVDRWRFYDYECGDLGLTPWQSDGTWAETIDLSCAAEDVIGPRGGMVWSLRAFEVSETRSLRLVIDSADGTASVQVFECGVDCVGSFVPQAARSASVMLNPVSTVAVYEPGRYWLRVGHAAGSDAAVDVGLE